MDESGVSSVAEYPLFQKGDRGPIPTTPLQLHVKQIEPQLACSLNATWHSRLPKIDWSNVVRNTHYVCYAATYDGRYYAVGIWSSPVAQNRFKDGKAMLELRRMAICKDAPANTATRMRSVMVRMIRNKFPDVTRLISYQDTEVHHGTIYKASNWFVAAESEGVSWSTAKRARNKEQTMAKKIRWEYTLR